MLYSEPASFYCRNFEPDSHDGRFHDPWCEDETCLCLHRSSMIVWKELKLLGNINPSSLSDNHDVDVILEMFELQFCYWLCIACGRKVFRVN